MDQVCFIQTVMSLSSKHFRFLVYVSFTDHAQVHNGGLLVNKFHRKKKTQFVNLKQSVHWTFEAGLICGTGLMVFVAWQETLNCSVEKIL